MILLAATFSTVSAKFHNSINNFDNSEFSTIKILKADDIDIAGKWNLKVQVPGQMLDVTLDLNQDAKTFSGSMSSIMGDGKVINGAIKEKDFTAVIQANIQGQDMEIQMSGTIDGDKMTGTLSVPNMDAISFEGTKAK